MFNIPRYVALSLESDLTEVVSGSVQTEIIT